MTLSKGYLFTSLHGMSVQSMDYPHKAGNDVYSLTLMLTHLPFSPWGEGLRKCGKKKFFLTKTGK